MLVRKTEPMNPSAFIPAAKSSRQQWPDLCRVISVFAVVLLHVTAERLALDRIHGSESLAVLAIRTIPAFAVPCFFMLSGMLWLSREKDASPSTMVRRILPITAAWIVWNAFYSAWPNTPSSASVPFLARLARPPRHLWFLPAIASCYLMAPGMRVLSRDRNAQRFTLCAAGVLLFLPSTARALFPALSDFVPAVSEIAALSFPVFYFLLGDFLARIPPHRLRRNRAWIVASGATCLSMTFLLAAFARIRYGELAAFVRPDHLFVAGYSAALFLLFRTADTGRPSPGWMVRLSQLCFGIYLVHPFFVRLIPCGQCGPVGSILLKSATVFACSAAATLTLRLLRPLRFIA